MKANLYVLHVRKTNLRVSGRLRSFLIAPWEKLRLWGFSFSSIQTSGIASLHNWSPETRLSSLSLSLPLSSGARNGILRVGHEQMLTKMVLMLDGAATGNPLHEARKS